MRGGWRRRYTHPLAEGLLEPRRTDPLKFRWGISKWIHLRVVQEKLKKQLKKKSQKRNNKNLFIVSILASNANRVWFLAIPHPHRLWPCDMRNGKRMIFFCCFRLLLLFFSHSVMCFQPKSLHWNSTRGVGAAAGAAAGVSVWDCRLVCKCVCACVWVGVCLHMCACGEADAKRRLKLA